MVNWEWVPGAGLLSRAWDATKLAGAIIDHRKQQKALVVAEHYKRVEKYRYG